MKTALVTGCTGFLGSHTVEYLLEKTDWNVIGVDSFIPRHRSDTRRIVKHPRYRIEVCDLAEEKLFIKEEVDVVFNLASQSHVDTSIQEPAEFCKNNYMLMLNMLEFARKRKLEAFVQCSTDEVFGAYDFVDGGGYGEWSPYAPSNPYAASKAAQDCLAMSYWRTYGVPVIITHAMNLFGEMQHPEKYIAKLISKISREEVVQVHGNRSVIGSRGYLYVKNVPSVWLKLLQHPVGMPAQKPFGRVVDKYNIAGQRQLDNLELAHVIAAMVGKTLKYELVDFHDARPGHDRCYSLTGDKLWSRRINEYEFGLMESLNKTVKWTLDHPEWMEN